MGRDAFVLVGCVAGRALAVIEGTVVGAITPTIVHDLGGVVRHNRVSSTRA